MLFITSAKIRNKSHFANAKYIARRKAYIAFLRQQKYIAARAKHAPCRATDVC